MNLAQLGEQRFLKYFDLFSGPSTLSTLVFLLLQKFEFDFRVRYCCVIRALPSDFNPSSYLQLWIGCVHQSWTAGTSLGEELMGLSSLGANDLILSGLITFKICHKPCYEWVVVTKTVHHLKFLQLSKFNDRSPIMARIVAIYQIHITMK